VKKGESFMRLAIVIVCLLVMCGLGIAADFSADFVVREKGKKEFTKGMVFVKGDKIRQEIREGKEKQITIFRPDRGVIWMVIPEQQACVLMPYKTVDKKFERWSSHKESEAEYLGEEAVSGLLCKKYQLTKNGERNYLWISDKFPFPVRMTHKDGTVEYKNIKAGNVSDSLFEISF
jgi:hypothetical protein